ncbi:MAG: peptide deformylase [Chlamydiae bacterium]|nr:peptide deformylase [Chlamydiota bacterium]MBI3276632.1 peptide deformylase [Chlamydiota bacterium]
MTREICFYPNPILRRKSQEVKTFDRHLRQLVEDMFETMELEGGVGFAAPQIGISERVLVIDLKAGPQTRLVVINPQLEMSGRSSKGTEGCLSIPGISAAVTRPSHVRVEGFDVKGKSFELEADGLMARALQHEVDHLDGIFFIDRLSSVERSLMAGKLRRFEKDFASGQKPQRILEKTESLL